MEGVGGQGGHRPTGSHSGEGQPLLPWGCENHLPRLELQHHVCPTVSGFRTKQLPSPLCGELQQTDSEEDEMTAKESVAGAGEAPALMSCSLCD